MMQSHCLRRGPHRRPGRKTIIDENHRAIGEIRRRRIVTIRTLAPLQLLFFLTRDTFDGRFRNPVPPHHVVIEHSHATRGNGAHRQLSMTGRAKLPDEKDIHRRTERRRDFVRNRHAAPRERKHDDVIAVRVLRKT